MEQTTENSLCDKKYYSTFAIGIATFFGGPLAAGILVRRNFIVLNQPEAGKMALIWGIGLSVILFTIIFCLPEDVINKIPNMAFPAIYTALILWWVDKKQGEHLKMHKEQGGKFYSIGRAIGIGLLSMVVLFVVIFLVLLCMPEEPM